jgi:hypothetical protein
VDVGSVGGTGGVESGSGRPASRKLGAMSSERPGVAVEWGGSG